MPFFQDKEAPRRTRVTADDRRLASKLRKFIGQRGWYVSKNKLHWAEQFRVLRGQLELGDVEATLDFYVEHMERYKLPSVRSGLEFKERFNWIRDVMLRHRLHSTDVVELSKDQARLFARLRLLPWPRDSAKYLAKAIVATCENYRKLAVGLLGYRLGNDYKELDLPTRNKVDHLFREFRSPVAFTERWLEHTYRKVKGWDDWNGKLMSMIPSDKPADDWFREYLVEVFSGYSAKPSLVAASLLRLVWGV